MMATRANKKLQLTFVINSKITMSSESVNNENNSHATYNTDMTEIVL